MVPSHCARLILAHGPACCCCCTAAACMARAPTITCTKEERVGDAQQASQRAVAELVQNFWKKDGQKAWGGPPACSRLRQRKDLLLIALARTHHAQPDRMPGCVSLQLLPTGEILHAVAQPACNCGFCMACPVRGVLQAKHVLLDGHTRQPAAFPSQQPVLVCQDGTPLRHIPTDRNQNTGISSTALHNLLTIAPPAALFHAQTSQPMATPWAASQLSSSKTQCPRPLRTSDACARARGEILLALASLCTTRGEQTRGVRFVGRGW